MANFIGIVYLIGLVGIGLIIVAGIAAFLIFMFASDLQDEDIEKEKRVQKTKTEFPL